MKKTILMIAFIAFAITGFAQSKSNWNEGRFERSKVYAEMAAKEFNLTKAQQKELYEMKVQHYEDQYEATQKFNKGEITKEEKKESNKKFGRYFNQLTGKNYKQLKPFFEKVNKELTKLN